MTLPEGSFLKYIHQLIKEEKLIQFSRDIFIFPAGMSSIFFAEEKAFDQKQITLFLLIVSI